jgi:hypothetical protein
MPNSIYVMLDNGHHPLFCNSLAVGLSGRVYIICVLLSIASFVLCDSMLYAYYICLFCTWRILRLQFACESRRSMGSGFCDRTLVIGGLVVIEEGRGVLGANLNGWETV